MVTAANIIGNDNVLQNHWIKRFIALIVDSVIFWVIAWALFWALPWGFPWWAWSFGIPFFYGLLFTLYAVIMEIYNNGQTLGKQVMNLRVVPLAGPMTFEKAFLRNISKIYSLFLLIDWLVGFFTEGDPKQKMLDRYAGTTVVSTEYPTGPAQQHVYQTPPGQQPPQQQGYQQQQGPVYQYQQPGQPPQQQSYPQQQQGEQRAAPEASDHKCDCGGSQILTGDGRYQCIRCGKIS